MALAACRAANRNRNGAPKPKNAAEAAKQFEALLIAQMLRTAHESNSGSLTTATRLRRTRCSTWPDSNSPRCWPDNGGLGLAKMIYRGPQETSGPGAVRPFRLIIVGAPALPFLFWLPVMRVKPRLRRPVCSEARLAGWQAIRYTE